jgi:hypothetical protein
MKELKHHIRRISSKFTEKWKSSGGSHERFLANNSAYLAEDLKCNVILHHPQPSTSTPGCPTKTFDDLSDKSKKRRLDDLLQERDTNQLMAAAEISARLAGHRNLACVIKEASNSPEKCQDMKRNISARVDSQRCLSKEEALAYYVDARATTHSYKQTRKWSMKAGHKVFPSFNSVRQAKLDCYPSEELIFVTETRAEINLQAVLNKTVERLISAQLEVFRSLPPDSSFSLISGGAMEILVIALTNKSLQTVKTLMSFYLCSHLCRFNYVTIVVPLFGRILDHLLPCIVGQLSLFSLKKQQSLLLRKLRKFWRK